MKKELQKSSIEDIQTRLPDAFPKIGDIYAIVGSGVQYRVETILYLFEADFPRHKLTHGALQSTRLHISRVEKILKLSSLKAWRYPEKRNLSYKAFRHLFEVHKPIEK